MLLLLYPDKRRSSKLSLWANKEFMQSNFVVSQALTHQIWQLAISRDPNLEALKRMNLYVLYDMTGCHTGGERGIPPGSVPLLFPPPLSFEMLCISICVDKNSTVTDIYFLLDLLITRQVPKSISSTSEKSRMFCDSCT